MLSNLLFGGLTALSTGSRFLDLERAEKSRQRREQNETAQRQKTQSELEWERMRGRLSKEQDQFDPSAQSQVSNLNKRTEALRKSKDRLRPGEYAAELQKLQQEATEFPWEHHIRKPEENVIEQNGVQFQKTDKGLEAFAFTPQYVQQNTVQLANGAMAIPIGPGKGYQVIEKATEAGRNMDYESQAIESASGGIDKIYRELEKKTLKTKEGGELSSEEATNLWTQAGDLYVTRSLQAKNAAKVLADGGGADAVIPGRTFNPYKMKENIQRMEKEKKVLQGQVKKNDKIMRQELEKRAGPPPMEPFTVSATPDVAGPGPEKPTKPTMEGTSKDLATRQKDLRAAFETTNEDNLTSMLPGGQTEEQLARQANLVYRPTAIESPEMVKTSQPLLNAPANTVVELPDGRRGIKRSDGPNGEWLWAARQTKKELAQPQTFIENPFVAGAGAIRPGKQNPFISGPPEEGGSAPMPTPPRTTKSAAWAEPNSTSPSEMVRRSMAESPGEIKLIASDVSGENAYDSRYTPDQINRIKQLQQEAIDAATEGDYFTSTTAESSIRRIQEEAELGRKPAGLYNYTPEGLVSANVEREASDRAVELQLPPEQKENAGGERRPATHEGAQGYWTGNQYRFTGEPSQYFLDAEAVTAATNAPRISYESRGKLADLSDGGFAWWQDSMGKWTLIVRQGQKVLRLQPPQITEQIEQDVIDQREVANKRAASERLQKGRPLDKFVKKVVDKKRRAFPIFPGQF